MRAQDLASGYADLNDEYERETETVPESALGRPAAAYLPVAGTRTAAQKMVMVEPPSMTALKLINDVAVLDPFAVMSRAGPMLTVPFNVVSTTAGGPMVSMFRRSTAESASQWKVPARFVMLDQEMTGGALTKMFHILPMYVGDGTSHPSDTMSREFYVAEEGRMLWDSYRSLLPGFSTWLTQLENADRQQGVSDALQLEVMNAVEGFGLGGSQNYGSVYVNAQDVLPRPALGARWERAKQIGIGPAPIATIGASEDRAARDAEIKMKERAIMVSGQVGRMNPEIPAAKELRQPEEVKPNREIGLDPNKPIGLERR
jgi:hypothetical protein